jgi:hypothetical protein
MFDRERAEDLMPTCSSLAAVLLLSASLVVPAASLGHVGGGPNAAVDRLTLKREP